MPSLDSILNSYIGRLVAFVLTPLLLPIAGAVSYWLQAKIGINMDPAVAVGFVVSVVTGIALVAYKWLHNNGLFEKAVVELHALYEAGRQQVAEQAKLPTTPPGVELSE